VYHSHDTIYDNIGGKIFSTALELVQMQISAPGPQKECRGVFHNGIICGHTITIDGKLDMDYFDREWWLQVDISGKTSPIESEFMGIHDLATLGGNTANALMQQLCGIGSSSNIFNPSIPRTKGPPSSARRDASGFEHRAKGRRRCSHCGGIGHNACTCNHNQAKYFAAILTEI